MTSFSATVGAWAQRVEDGMTDVMRLAAADVASAVSVGNEWAEGTPVDTGYARNSWVAGIGSVDSTPPLGPRNARAEAGAYGSGGDIAMLLTVRRMQVTDTLILQNNAEYVPYLEDGRTTPKTGKSGWIRQTAHQWPAIIVKAVARVKRAKGLT